MINVTETASIHSINRAEILTSRHAIPIEIAVTIKARKTAEATCPVASCSSKLA